MEPHGSLQGVASQLFSPSAYREHASVSFNEKMSSGGEPDVHGVQRQHPGCAALDALSFSHGAATTGTNTTTIPVTGAAHIVPSSQTTTPVGDALLPREHFSPHVCSGESPVSAKQIGMETAPKNLPIPPDDSDIPPTLFGTCDLQRGLLEQKVQHLQRELNGVREELRETSKRFSHATVKLNEQKVEFSALTHRYGSSVEKLTASESSVKQLEEQLVSERKQHNLVREERDSLKSTLRELDWEVEKLRRELQDERNRQLIDPQEVQHMLEDRTRFIPTEELQHRLDDMRVTQHAFTCRILEGLDTLLLMHEEDETSVFVARSAVLSAATDLEARVATAESTLAALRGQIELFNEGTEHDIVEMLTTLMMENKELWQHLSKLKGDYDTTVTQLAALRRKSNFVPPEQREYVQKQLTLTNDKLIKAQKAVEVQVEVAKEHEEQMKAMINSNKLLQDRVCQLTEQVARAPKELERLGQQLEEAGAQKKEALRRANEAKEVLDHERHKMDKSMLELKEKLSATEKEYEQRISLLQEERDAARKDTEKALRELGDVQKHTEALQREIDSRNREFQAYKQQVEEHQQQVNRSLQEEMINTRELLVHDLSLTRRDLEDQRTYSRETERQRDDERAERLAAQAVAARLETELSQQRCESEQQQRRLKDLSARLQKLEAETNHLQERRDEALEEARELQRDVKRLQEHSQELERQLQEQRESHSMKMAQLQKDRQEFEQSRNIIKDELRSLRTRLADFEQQRVPRHRADAEKENLMRENLRLHEQYQEVQQENVTLRENLQQLQRKVLNFDQLSQQLDDVHERLRQLPSLRQATEDAKRDAMRATEETEELRQERDAMAAKLSFFLEESKQAAKRDEEWCRVFRDAAEQTQRLGCQVSMAKQQQQKQRCVPAYVSAHPSGYSDCYSNYQRVLDNDSGVGSLRKRQASPSQPCRETGSPQPTAPTLQRPWH